MEKQADIRISSAIDRDLLHKDIRKIEKFDNYWLSSYIILKTNKLKRILILSF